MDGFSGCLECQNRSGSLKMPAACFQAAASKKTI